MWLWSPSMETIFHCQSMLGFQTDYALVYLTQNYYKYSPKESYIVHFLLNTLYLESDSKYRCLMYICTWIHHCSSMFYYKMTLGSKIHLVWGITTTLLLLVICFAKLQLILGCREKTNSVCYWQQFSWKQWQFYVRSFKWLLGKV